MSNIAILFLCLISLFLRPMISVENVDFLMSSVNGLALLIVLVSIFEMVDKNLNSRFETMKNKTLVPKIKVHFYKIRNWTLLIVFILCFIYVTYFKNPIINDILSVISLTLSITVQSFSDILTKVCFNKK